MNAEWTSHSIAASIPCSFFVIFIDASLFLVSIGCFLPFPHSPNAFGVQQTCATELPKVIKEVIISRCIHRRAQPINSDCTADAQRSSQCLFYAGAFTCGLKQTPCARRTSKYWLHKMVNLLKQFRFAVISSHLEQILMVVSNGKWLPVNISNFHVSCIRRCHICCVARTISHQKEFIEPMNYVAILIPHPHIRQICFGINQKLFERKTASFRTLIHRARAQAHKVRMRGHFDRK